MPQKSSIAKLDADVRGLIDDLIRDGGWTLDEIRDELNTRFPGKTKPSRSALGRYSQSMEDIGKKLRESREMAAVWTERLGREPEGDVAKLVMEMLRTLAFDITLQLNESPTSEIDPADINKLALAMQRLESAGKWNIEREKQMRAAIATDVETKLQSGPRKLDSETYEFIRRAVRGEHS